MYTSESPVFYKKINWFSTQVDKISNEIKQSRNTIGLTILGQSETQKNFAESELEIEVPKVFNFNF